MEGSSTILSDIAYMDSSSSIVLKPLPPNSPIGQSERIEKTSVAKNTSNNNVLVFFEGINWAFDLAELLGVEAEMPGKGTYKQHGCISEYGLTTLINQAIPPDTKIPGYQAPEVSNTGKVSQASDVYSYGILLLELFIGKSPAYSTGRDENYHLIQWVNSVIRQEWTARVFDIELLSYPNIEEEMVELLQIGMACAQTMAEQRPKMKDVVKMVEDIRRDLY
ncbi:hypothetical protein LguiB_026717 [Lonicera macranthoides]